MAYRATRHRMTGKSPAELMFGRRIQTKLPRLLPKAQGTTNREARQTHEEQRAKQKAYTDAKLGAKVIQVGDDVMLAQKKTTTKPSWGADPWEVKEGGVLQAASSHLLQPPPPEGRRSTETRPPRPIPGGEQRWGGG